MSVPTTDLLELETYIDHISFKDGHCLVDYTITNKSRETVDLHRIEVFVQGLHYRYGMGILPTHIPHFTPGGTQIGSGVSFSQMKAVKLDDPEAEITSIRIDVWYYGEPEWKIRDRTTPFYCVRGPSRKICSVIRSMAYLKAHRRG